MNNLIAKTELDNRMLKIFSPVVEDMGFEIVRVRLVDGRSKLIQVMVDNSSGTINVDECAKISTELSAIIDLEDPYDDPFNLEVSSPGIDRPLTRLNDFETWNGYEAKIETTEAIDGQKRFKGILAGINNEEVLNIALKEAKDICDQDEKFCEKIGLNGLDIICLLYTSDAADE